MPQKFSVITPTGLHPNLHPTTKHVHFSLPFLCVLQHARGVDRIDGKFSGPKKRITRDWSVAPGSRIKNVRKRRALPPAKQVSKELCELLCEYDVSFLFFSFLREVMALFSFRFSFCPPLLFSSLLVVLCTSCFRRFSRFVLGERFLKKTRFLENGSWGTVLRFACFTSPLLVFFTCTPVLYLHVYNMLGNAGSRQAALLSSPRESLSTAVQAVSCPSSRDHTIRPSCPQCRTASVSPRP